MDRAKRSQDVGRRLQETRMAAEMTLRSLSARAKVGASTISDTEKGHHIPAADTIESLADALGVSPCWLAFGIGPKVPRVRAKAE